MLLCARPPCLGVSLNRCKARRVCCLLGGVEPERFMGSKLNVPVDRYQPPPRQKRHPQRPLARRVGGIPAATLPITWREMIGRVVATKGCGRRGLPKKEISVAAVSFRTASFLQKVIPPLAAYGDPPMVRQFRLYPRSRQKVAGCPSCPGRSAPSQPCEVRQAQHVSV